MRLADFGEHSETQWLYLEQVVGPQGTLFAFDYTPEMLEVARRYAAQSWWREHPIQRGPVGAAARRDPVCGMAIGEEPTALTATFNDRLYVFCSEAWG